MNKICNLKKSSIEELLNYINELTIPYRNILNINNNNLTFGIELEFLGLFYNDVEKLIETRRFKIPMSSWLVNNDNYENWQYIRETAHHEDGCEITTPIFIDRQKYWNQINTMCSDLIKYGATAENCSTHMHFGAHIITKDDQWATLIKLWIVYEQIIYNFYYGEECKPRYGIDHYAKSINLLQMNKIQDHDLYYDVIANYNSLLECNAMDLRNHGLNLYNAHSNYKKRKNTIEVRVPNGTLNKVIIQNNINFFSRLLISIIKDKIDIDYIDYKFNNRQINNVISTFNNFSINDVLELSDMIFLCEEDKLYFLKQCYKLFNLNSIEKDEKIKRILKKQ